MEDVIQTYLLPYNPTYPVVCFDEASKQLFGEVQELLPTRPGSPAKQDYEYERKGVCNQLMLCEPLRGWRHVRVSQRRTRKDYELPDKTIGVVPDEDHTGSELNPAQVVLDSAIKPASNPPELG